jgi:spermidine synthase
MRPHAISEHNEDPMSAAGVCSPRFGSADAFIHHEMMAHVPLFAHAHVERVLIVGGADCGLAEEVLKHPHVRALVQVADDPRWVDGARSHVIRNPSVLADRRFQLRIAASTEFVASTNERFDLMLVDIGDPVGASLAVLTENFFRDARGCLNSGGVLISRLGAPFLQPLAFLSAMKRLSAVFHLAAPYLLPVPSVLGGPVAIGWGSNVLAPGAPTIDVLAARFAHARIGTRYYTPEVHRASFALPRSLNDAVQVATRPDEADASEGAAAGNYRERRTESCA